MRLAVCFTLVLVACGQRDPTVTTTTAAVFAPTAHDTRTEALAEQRDSRRAEERASRSRPHATSTTSQRPSRRASARAVPAPSPTPHAGGCGPGKKSSAAMVACWTPLVSRYPWPSLGRVWSVMTCESQGDQNATGMPTRAGRARGLLQLMEGPYDPAQNIAGAWTKSKHGTDWSPWDCA